MILHVHQAKITLWDKGWLLLKQFVVVSTYFKYQITAFTYLNDSKHVVHQIYFFINMYQYIS